jgi:acyl-CoA synthetase (AMP-forming)/AMP-acid ligase II
MKSNDALLAAWETTRARAKDAPAIFDTRGEITRTFHQIEADARDFEAKIGIFAAGCVVAIQIGNHEDWPAILVACLRKRLVVLPLEQTISEQARDAGLSTCQCAGLITAENTAPLVRKIDNCIPDWGDQPPSLLKLTSGTTAAPRAIRFRSKQLLADCDQICDTMGITEVDLNFGLIPISHSYGFSNLLTPLLARGVPMVLSRDRTPRAVLADLARAEATVFPGMPVLYQAFCEMENTPALPKLRLCISAGAPLPIVVARKFQEKFERSIHSFYGASECGGICYDRDGSNEIEGFVGQAMKDVHLDLVEETTSASQVRVCSAAVGDGYFPEAEETKLGRGVFIPDDLLKKTANGFRIVGRVSDVINVAGKKVNPAEVEAHLLRFSGVHQAVVFGRESALRNEEVAACVVADADLREADLLEFCRSQLSGWQAPKQIFIVDVIPVNERGKISRRDLARRFPA